MEKKQISLSKKEDEKILYQGYSIFVNPHITQAEKIELINRYIHSYFYPDEQYLFISGSRYDYINAEFDLIMHIVELKTSIKIDESFDFDDFMTSGLWKMIVEKIDNYYNLLEDLDRVVSDIKEQMNLDKSIGKVIDDLSSKIYDLIFDFSNKIENLDPDKMKSAGIELLNQIEKSPVSEIFKESSKIPSRKSNKGARVH